MQIEHYTKDELVPEIADTYQKIETREAHANTLHSTSALLAEHTSLLALSAAVGTALAGSDSLRAILQRCTDAMVQHLSVASAGIWTVQPEQHVLETQAGAGLCTPFAPSVRMGQSAIGLIAQERQPYITNTIRSDPRLSSKAWAEQTGMMAFAGYPLVVEDRLIGVMAMFARQPFTPATLQSLNWVAGVIAMGIDRMSISNALARSIAKVIRMNKSLRRKNAELDDFTSVASHDLQEPLRQLMTRSSLLRQDLGTDLAGRAARDLAGIVDAATRLQTLIRHLLELSRISNTAMHCEQVPLETCASRALQNLATRTAATGATVMRDALPTVWGDRAMLIQLYQHLLSNALKFCDKGRPLIHLTATMQGEHVVLGVKDNGMGIKPAYHEQIFAPFKRLHGRDTYDGTGIGLAICRKTVERHGGCLWVESDLGLGAHFKFTLPEHPEACPITGEL
jgi:signal transduction histidine kinase